MFGLKRLNKQDLLVQSDIHPMMVSFFSSLPPAEKNRHKFSFTSRLVHSDGREVQVLQNNFFLKWDDLGNPLVKLITFTDITRYKKSSDVIFYVTRLGHEGKNEVVLQKNFTSNIDTTLTPRELEVLEATSNGLSSQMVAEKLSIEVTTIKITRRAF